MTGNSPNEVECKQNRQIETVKAELIIFYNSEVIDNATCIYCKVKCTTDLHRN